MSVRHISLVAIVLVSLTTAAIAVWRSMPLAPPQLAPPAGEALVKITPHRIPMTLVLATYCVQPQTSYGPHADAAEILVYANPTAIEYRRQHPDKFNYPIGSKFVKEKFSQPADKSPDMATIMERRSDSGDISDWRFAIVSLPDKIELPQTGRVTCAGCHQDYKDTGYVSDDSENALKQYLKNE